MQTITKFFLTLFLICFSLTAFAEEVNETLTKLLKNMRSMQANFVQTTLDKKGKPMDKSTGRMALQRPNQFRWDIQRPNHQLIVANGKRLWIYDPGLEQVTIRSLTKSAGEVPALLLSDKELSLGKEFTVKPLKNTASMQWFLLIPKDRNSTISSLKLGFLNEQIQQMELKDHLGNATHIEFKHIVLNSTLSNSTFNFKPPAHIDIIDETKNK